MNSPVGGSGGVFQAAAPTGTGGLGYSTAQVQCQGCRARVTLTAIRPEGLLPTGQLQPNLAGTCAGLMVRIYQRPIDAKADERAYGPRPDDVPPLVG